MSTFLNGLQEVPIGDFCQTGSGGTPSRSKAARYFGGSIPWVKSGELRETVITETEECITAEGLAESAAKLLPANTLLVALYGATVGRIGVLGIEATTNQAVCYIIPDERRADRKYLYYALQSKVPVWLSQRVGGGQPNISQGIIKDTKIPLPSLSEQKRIADILDKADAIRRKRQEAQQHASDLFTAAFIDRFGDPVTNPKNWERVQLPLITKRITVGIVVKPASYYVDEGVPALRSLNVRVNRIEKENFVFFSEKDNEGPLSKTRVWKEDVLLVRSGQPGTAAVVPEDLDGVNAIDVLIVTPDLERVTSQYLCYLFNSPAGKRLVLGEERGQIQKHLNVSSLKKLEVPLPPIREQRDFNRFLAVTASMRAQLANASVAVDALFNSLAQRAFKGEL